MTEGLQEAYERLKATNPDHKLLRGAGYKEGKFSLTSEVFGLIKFGREAHIDIGKRRYTTSEIYQGDILVALEEKYLGALEKALREETVSKQ